MYKGDKLIDFSHKLSRLHRSALPNAVRFTLTDSAKDVKFRTLKKHARKEFDVKKASFFSKFSGYSPAKGFDISKMKAVAGMVKGMDSKSVASTEIAQQQFAGTLHNKSYAPAKNQRTSKGLVKSSYLTERSKKPIIAEKGKSFFVGVSKARDKQRPLLIKKNNRGVLVKIGKTKKNKKIPAMTPIASYKENRKIELKHKHPFVNNAALESAKLLNSNFKKHAQKQIARYLK
jgi:hypothetical protein